ncbi:MAG: PRC-barrel domain-containing protein [Acidobacteriota bacterium]
MLHYITKLKGYHIIATDGDAGHVDDFLVDEGMVVRHLVVDTSNWFGGESVLIPTAALQKIDSPNKQIQVTLSRDDIKGSPGVDTADIELIETLPPPII